MTIEACQGWLIHKWASGDTSNRLMLFTREAGLIKCHFRGGRLPKNQAILQAFQPLWLMFDHRTKGSFLNKIEASSSSLSLTGTHLFAGLYLNELLYHVQPEGEAYPDLYDAYEYTLNALAFLPADTEQRLAMELLLRRFEWQLLSQQGLLCSFEHEANSSTMIQPQQHYQLVPGHGFIASQQGYLGEHLVAISLGHLDNPAILLTAKRIMRSAIHHLLDGKTLQSRRLFAAC